MKNKIKNVMIKLKTLFFLLLFSAVTFAQENNVDKRVVYLWDVTYSMHGGLHGKKYPAKEGVVIGGQPQKIVEYNKKYDIYKPVMEALIRDINSQNARTEIVVIPFNIRVCEVWKKQGTDAGKEYLVNNIQTYCNLQQTKTSIYNALEYAKQHILKSDVPNELKILTDGNEHSDTYNAFIKTLENWCDFAEKNNVKASYYFILSNDILKDKPDLENLLESSCFTPTVGGVTGGTVDLDPKSNYKVQENITISSVDDYGKTLSIAFTPEKATEKLNGEAKISVKILPNSYLSLDEEIIVDANTQRVELTPKWLMPMNELRDVLPAETSVEVEYSVKNGNLVLIKNKTLITIKNKKIKKMNLELK
jgi:hypothetical protein